MRVLVTGGNGFVGSHVVAALRARGDDVFSARRSPEGAGHLALDLSDAASVARVVERARAQIVFHLAAQAFVPEAIADPLATYETNVLGTARLLEALRALRDGGGPAPRVVVASSAEVYGPRPPEAGALDESLALRPANPYGASKAAAEALAQGTARTYGLDVVIARGFNQIGPGQDPRFVVPSFARQLAAIAQGGVEPVLHVGNLEARRDFLDVRDAVEAYLLLAERGERGEAYNVCSGRATPIREVLRLLIGRAGLPVEIRQDPARMRPSDNPLIVGNPAKLSARTGWTPRYGLEESLRAVYDDARARAVPAAGPVR